MMVKKVRLAKKGMANLGVYWVGVIIVLSISVGLGSIYTGFAETYNIQQTDKTLIDLQSYQKIKNITDDIAINVRETGIEDESSTSKIISVGWNSLKLFLQFPGIMANYFTSLGGILNFNVGGINFIYLGIVVFSIWIIWSVIYAIFFRGEA